MKLIQLLRWWAACALRTGRRRLGWYVIAAFLVIPVSGVLLAVGVMLEQKHESLRDEFLSQRPELPTGRSTYWKQVGEGLDEFYAYLPASTVVPETVSGLISLGRAGGLVLRTGDYQARPEPSAGYLRYEIVLPIVGDASDVQSFVLRALWKYPTMSFESVTFKRQSIDSHRVESRLRMALLTSLEGDGDVLVNEAGE